MTIPDETKAAATSPPIFSPSPDRITEMKKVDNSSNPTVLPVGKVTANWTYHILDKDDGKWTDWSYNMELELSMAQLWEYAFDPPPAPHQTYEPRAYRAWNSNNRLTCSFIKRALSPSEQKLCTDEWNPVALWRYLKDRHGGAVPVQQVRLLQEALTTKCSPTESLTKTADTIFAKIDRAFDVGDVTKDLLKSIAILSALSDRSYAHIRSIVSRDLTTAADMEKYGPAEICRFLEGEQTLIDADKSNVAPAADPTPTAFTAKSSRYEKLICTGCKAKDRPNYTGHTQLWCILEGGGMEGKTIEESRKARIAKAKKKATSKFTITPSGGSAFTIEGDSNAIAAYIATQGKPNTVTKTEFAGLASDKPPVMGSLDEVEALEFDMLIALEEELKSGKVTWSENRNEEALSSAIIPFDNQPFFLDSGATIHISPDASDFVTLTPILERSI